MTNMSSDKKIGSSPYDVWLIENHYLTQSLPLDDTRSNKLIVNWYRPGQREPSVRLTRLINVLLDGNVTTQDTIDKGFGHFIELSAEFTQDGTLIKSDEYADDPFFLELTNSIHEINQTEGASMSSSFNGTPMKFFDLHEGGWSPRNEGSVWIREDRKFLK